MGGAQLSLFSLVTCMESEGFIPHVLSADKWPGGMLDRCRDRGIHCERIRCGHWHKSPYGVYRFLRDRRKVNGPLRRALAQVNPALVHLNGVRSALLTFGKLPEGIPVVLHDRDIRMPAIARAFAARQADRVVAISQCVRRKWIGVLPDECLAVVPNGFDVDHISRVGPGHLPSSLRSGPVAVCVGDMVRWKRHDLFLRSLAHIRSQGVAVAGLIIGRAHDRPGEQILRELSDLADTLGISPALTIVSDADDALPWISAGDVLVSVAEGEPFGRAVVEGLALGKAVVATRGWGPEEILTGCRGGFLTDDTAEDVGRGIANALDGIRSGIVRDASQRRARDFSLGRMACRIKAIYGELIPDA